MKKLFNLWPYMAIGTVLLIVAVVAGYFFYKQGQQNILGINNASNPSAVEVKRLVAEVGKLMELPTGEDPTVATVTDVSKLKEQDFFKKAKNGDKVLIYSSSKKAILYDPDSKKIIDVSTLNIGTSSAEQATSSASAAVSAQVIIRNGTSTTGLTNKIEPEVKISLPDAQILTKENATRKDYSNSLVVLLTPSFKPEADKLAKDLNITVENLPEGEQSPQNGDILLILGQDKSGI